MKRFSGFLVHVPFLWVEGMAFFPFVFCRRKQVGIVFKTHESIHLRQQLEMGLILFYLWYFAEYLFRLAQLGKHADAYYNISFEREAYRNERDPQYLQTRKLWAFLRYLHRSDL